MSFIRYLAVLAVAMLATGCSTFTDHHTATLPREAAWGLVPVVNFSQAPQAGERVEQILLSVLAEQGLQPRHYPAAPRSDLPMLDDRSRLSDALAWAASERLDYVISGSVEEWQYKSGGRRACGRYQPAGDRAGDGRVVWSKSGARAGWSRESLAGTGQKVLRELAGALRLE